MSRIRNKRGFTLIELVVVMAIIAVLAVLVIGAITVTRRQSRKSQLLNDAKTIQLALEKYRSKFGSYPPLANPYNGTFDAYIMVNDAYDTVTPQAGTPNLKGILIPYLDKKIDRPFANNQGRICYYGATGVYQYLLWVQTEDVLDKHPTWSTGGCPNTHGTVLSEAPGSVFSLK